MWQGDGFIGQCDGTFEIMTCASATEASPKVNEYDFAWCEVDADCTSPEIYRIYEGNKDRLLSIRREPHLYEPVRWIGQRTGEVQESTITDLDYRLKKPSAYGGWEYWGGLINLATYPGGPVLADGDSGSALFADDDKSVIGLLSMASEDGAEIVATRIPDDKLGPAPNGQEMRLRTLSV